MSEAPAFLSADAGSEPEPKARRYRAFVLALVLLGMGGALFGFVMRQVAKDPCSSGCISAADTQAMLRKADAAAKHYLAQHGGFRGFTVDTATQIDPSIDWIVGDTAVGKVAVRRVASSRVLLVSTDATGQGYCVLEDKVGGTSYAKTDAQQASECKGGGW